MLAGKRAKRVGDQILKEIAVLLLEKVRDPRVEGVTLTGIHLSNDLKLARVYFSVLGGQKGVDRGQKGLDSAKGFIKREIGHRMDLRYVPELMFLHDRSLESGSRLERILEKLKEEEPEDDTETDFQTGE
jgi:ribosome-binding factor A